MITDTQKEIAEIWALFKKTDEKMKEWIEQSEKNDEKFRPKEWWIAN